MYRALGDRDDVELRVFFGSDEGVRAYTAGFGDASAVSWGSDLIAGYSSEWLPGAREAQVQAGFLALRGEGIERRLDEFAPDVVWVHGYSYLLMVRAIVHALRRRVPVLVREEQTLLVPRRGPRRLIRALVLRLLLRRVWALAIGANSRAFFLHHGVAPERIGQANYLSALPLAPRLPSDDGRLRLLFVGKLTEKKAPGDLVESFAAAFAGQDGSPRLTIVGDGPLRGSLERRVRELGIEQDVEFAGFVGRADLPTVLARHDVFCLPSVGHETWGVVVAEAMAAGLVPVVSTRVGAAADLVRDGWNGRVFRAGDVCELAGVLSELVADPGRVIEMSARCEQLIEGWSLSTATEGVASILRRMARAH
ncbi:MAG: glycosyltransferase family 4 protein [Actinomycetes bacterium]